MSIFLLYHYRGGNEPFLPYGFWDSFLSAWVGGWVSEWGVRAWGSACVRAWENIRCDFVCVLRDVTCICALHKRGWLCFPANGG